MKDLKWIGDSREVLASMPVDVKQTVGYALHEVQTGKFPRTAKPFKGQGSGVYEIVCDYDTNTYRAVYVVNIGDCIYVLHAFQKKSKKGIKTPKNEVAIIQNRLKQLRMALGIK